MHHLLSIHVIRVHLLIFQLVITLVIRPLEELIVIN